VIIHKQCFYEYTNKKISNPKLELSIKAKAGIKHERKVGIINLSGLIAMRFWDDIKETIFGHQLITKETETHQKGASTFSVTTFSIATISIMDLIAKLAI
jgi:hypothetical protein